MLTGSAVGTVTAGMATTAARTTIVIVAMVMVPTVLVVATTVPVSTTTSISENNRTSIEAPNSWGNQGLWRDQRLFLAHLMPDMSSDGGEHEDATGHRIGAGLFAE